ncbi:hypothetical protein D9M71_792210 [compost metagenome]
MIPLPTNGFHFGQVVCTQTVPFCPVLCLLRKAQAMLPVLKSLPLLLQDLPSLLLCMFQRGKLVGVILLADRVFDQRTVGANKLLRLLNRR